MRVSCFLVTVYYDSQDSIETASVMTHQLIAGMIHQIAGPSRYSHVLSHQESRANIHCDVTADVYKDYIIHQKRNLFCHVGVTGKNLP